jgi:hypothetical protein
VRWSLVVGACVAASLSVGAASAWAQGADSTSPFPPAAIPTVETGPAMPMLPLDSVGVPTVAVGAIDAVCRTTPALKAALNSHPGANLGTVEEACALYGKPLTQAQIRRERVWRSRVPSACGNAGCDYIWLDNNGGGWGLVEYETDINNGCIAEGTAFFYRYTESSDTTGYWSQSNGGGDATCEIYIGTHYIYPIAQVSGGGSWVQANLTSGWEFLNTGLTDYYIPVTTWNYITH